MIRSEELCLFFKASGKRTRREEGGSLTAFREKKHLTKDIHSYRIPEDTGKIFSVLMGIVKND